MVSWLTKITSSADIEVTHEVEASNPYATMVYDSLQEAVSQMEVGELPLAARIALNKMCYMELDPEQLRRMVTILGTLSVDILQRLEAHELERLPEDSSISEARG